VVKNDSVYIKLCFVPQLAKYCDGLLKKSTKGIGDAELDEKLNGSIVIFKYLDDKDVFQRVCP